MTVLDKSKRLKKQLGPISVYAIATGTTLSSGLFLLPGLAADMAGPAVIASYMIAAIPLIPAAISVVELATATPRAGGAYYFLDRSMGPMMGTIGGIGTWLALILKTAFALVGMGAYLSLFVHDVPITTIAILLAVAFGVLNLVGAKATGSLQVVLVGGVLASLAWFVAAGVPRVDTTHFEGFWNAGFDNILQTAAMVYVSYVGVTKVASVSEEVRDPEKNLPRAVFYSVLTAIAVYGFGVVVIVGVLPKESLYGDLTPVATAAEAFAGKWGKLVVAIAAILAFSSVANAGILSASRYPLAMSRDHLMPRVLARLGKDGIPRIAVIFTLALVVGVIVAFDPSRIAKLASSFQLLMFALVCAAVIVMRESRIESYDPSFRSPLYPYTQIVGIMSAGMLLAQMGWLPQAFTVGLVGFSLVWWFRYCKPRVARPGAVMHVFERLGRERSAALDAELRGILKEKGMRTGDPFAEVVADAHILDIRDRAAFDDITYQAAKLLANHIPETPDWIVGEILEGTRVGATPVSGGVALPHCRHKGLKVPHLVLARIRKGVSVEPGDEAWGEHTPDEVIYAVFVLASPESTPGQHLRMLANIAKLAEDAGFMDKWLAARDEVALKRLLIHPRDEKDEPGEDGEPSKPEAEAHPSSSSPELR